MSIYPRLGRVEAGVYETPDGLYEVCREGKREWKIAPGRNGKWSTPISPMQWQEFETKREAVAYLNEYLQWLKDAAKTITLENYGG
jgi:hypothetical protein